MNDPSVSLFIIIPCFNEAESICTTLSHLLEVRKEALLVVINDGSSDTSAEKIRSVNSSRIRLIDMPFNAGIGTAVETGLLYAVRHNAEYVVKFDGDGQHDENYVYWNEFILKGYLSSSMQLFCKTDKTN